MDSANPSVELLQAIVRLTDRIPNLRVVLDHLPAFDVSASSEKTLRELAKRNIYAKLSAVARRVNGKVEKNPEAYKPRLDLLFDIFGEDRVVYGSDWPNSTGNWVPYEGMLTIVQSYFKGKGRPIAEKYFWKNSISAYRWIKRAANQPALA